MNWGQLPFAAALVAAAAFSAGCPPSAPPAVTATPTSAPVATPAPSFTPQPTPAGRAIVSVVVTPATATIYVAPNRGRTPAHALSVQLSAKVTYSDGTSEDKVDWRSGEGDRAIVDETGLVSAGAEGGAVLIFATSKDGKAKGSALVSVKNDAALEVGVD